MSHFVSYYSAARGALFGALDAQLALVDFVCKLPPSAAITTNIMSLFESVVRVSKEIIDIQETVVPHVENDDNEIDSTICFQQNKSKGNLTSFSYSDVVTCRLLEVLHR